MTNRYLLFAGSTHYPGGGWDDFITSFQSLEEAKAAVGNRGEKEWGRWKIQGDDYDWYQIVDIAKGNIVETH